MPADLYSQAAGTVVAGTVTSEIWDSDRLDTIEVFAISAGGSVAAKVDMLFDARDLDGNWYNAATGSIQCPVSGTVTQRIGRGAAGSAVMGVKGRVRLITSGTMDFRVNVVGF